MFNSLVRLCLVPLAAAATLALPHAAPQSDGRPQQTSDPVQIKTDQVFQSGIEVVSVTATVTDQNGRLVPNLGREAFTIYEDGQQQDITQFQYGRVPVSLGIVLDVSDSMRGERMDDARLALERFVDDLLEPSDEVFLVSFNHSPQVLAGWTTPPGEIGHPLDGVRPFGGTAIYDAMAAAIPLFLSRSHQRAAVLLISDGADTASDSTVRQVRQLLRRSEAFVYAIAIDAEEKRPINDRVNPYALSEITDESGGYTEVIHQSSDLGPATARIAEELNQQYMLGYTLKRPPDSEFHSIRVRMKNELYKVRARRGYVAVPDVERRPSSKK